MCGIWNKALLGKQVWSIATKEDSLWVRWVHGRYLKHHRIWEVTEPSNASWHWRKLVRIKDLLLPAVRNGMWSQSKDGLYSPQSGYMWLMGDVQHFASARVVWNKLNIPTHGFIMWLTCHKKLLTRDRLKQWNIRVDDDRCLLCGEVTESIAHLFFRFEYSHNLCNLLVAWLQVHAIPVLDWEHWLVHLACRGGIKSKIMIAAVSAAVYLLWKERNTRLHGAARQEVNLLMFQLKRALSLRVLGTVPLNQKEQAEGALRQCY